MLRSFFLFLSFYCLCVSLFVFRSMIQERKVISDFNNGTISFKYDEIDNIFFDLPNIGATTIPLEAYEAMYYLAYGDNISALNKVYSIPNSTNPHLHYTEHVKSLIYEKLNLIDSALFYSKEAFYNWPKNIEHFRQYTNLLASKGDSTESINSFDFVDDIYVDRLEYSSVFAKSLAKSRLFYLLRYTDLKSINNNSLIGDWVRVIEYEGNNIQYFDDSQLTFLSNNFLITNSIKYYYEQKNDTIKLKHSANINGPFVSSFLIKFSSKYNTLVMRPSQDNGYKADRYFKKH